MALLLRRTWKRILNPQEIDRFTPDFVHEVENIPERQPNRFDVLPARVFHGHWIDEAHVPLFIRGDDTVADARQSRI